MVISNNQNSLLSLSQWPCFIICILFFISLLGSKKVIGQEIISKDTTKTHIRNIYQKLQVKGKADAIEKATRERLI